MRSVSLFLGLAVALHGRQPAEACVGGDDTIETSTTFDPAVLGDNTPDGLYYEPFVSGFGDICDDCLKKDLLADWTAYLHPTTAEDWEKVLLQATPAELVALSQRSAGKTATKPAGYEQSSIWRTDPAKLHAAVELVRLARRLEPLATFDRGAKPEDVAADAKAYPAALADATAGWRASGSDLFLKQRYAFQVLRVLFYKKDWAGAVSFYDKNRADLSAPSNGLSWRARHYLSGALLHDKRYARGNLELARIHVGYPPLSSAAVNDFHPMEEADWQETLRLAADVREKTELWRIVGIRLDGIAAITEIVKLDPGSNLIGLLLVREIARAEGDSNREIVPPDPGHKRAIARLEKLTLELAKLPSVDRPWLLDLVAGHLAALRGDLAMARPHLERAMKGKPGDALVATQARASLAMALARSWKITPQNEEEVARTMLALDPKFKRIGPLTDAVRNTLAAAYLAAGRPVDAEYLEPGSIEPTVPQGGKATRSRWTQPKFILDMIAHRAAAKSPFERFVIGSAFQEPALQQELALRYLVNGDPATSLRTFQSTDATTVALGTDPFVIHVVDCHDCDHAKYEKASWTHASFVAHMAELDKAAEGTGEPAAQAAFQLGNGYYNITWYGNARSVLENSHQETNDTHLAERWYKRAFDLTQNRELKAKAAFMAAKAELAELIEATTPNDGSSDSLPIPKTWFPIVKTFADTRYYQEILTECDHYRKWAQ